MGKVWWILFALALLKYMGNQILEHKYLLLMIFEVKLSSYGLHLKIILSQNLQNDYKAIYLREIKKFEIIFESIRGFCVLMSMKLYTDGEFS